MRRLSRKTAAQPSETTGTDLSAEFSAIKSSYKASIDLLRADVQDRSNVVAARLQALEAEWSELSDLEARL